MKTMISLLHQTNLYFDRILVLPKAVQWRETLSTLSGGRLRPGSVHVQNFDSGILWRPAEHISNSKHASILRGNVFDKTRELHVCRFCNLSVSLREL